LLLFKVIINFFFNKVKSYSLNKYDIKIYGISQHPNIKDYIMVLQEVYCERCGGMYKENLCKLCRKNDLKENYVNWTSGNKKIDKFIQEMQLKIIRRNEIIFEWIPYDLFDDIEEISKDEFGTLHSASWKNEFVYLKLLHNSQYNIDEFLNKVLNLHIIYFDIF
jgi:hypothetical protein